MDIRSILALYFITVAIIILLMLYSLVRLITTWIDQRAQVYTGEVVHREVLLSPAYGMGTRVGNWQTLVLRVRTDTGEEFDVQANGRVYKAVDIGDRVVKVAGRRWPQKEA